MTVALVCIGLLGILIFGLGLSVSLTRGRTDRAAGFADDPTDRLYKMVRAHGNTTEYAPFLAILIFIVGESLAKPHPLRFVGALGTYVFGLALCGTPLRSL